MPFSASIFIPKKARRFDLTLSEKLYWYSIIAIISYPLLLLLIETSIGYKLPKCVYYPIIAPLTLWILSEILRLSEYENLNGIFEGTFSFQEDFLIINSIEYQYSKLENLIIYGNSYSGQKNENTRSGPMYSNGVNNLISFTYEKEKIVIHFQLNSLRHVDELQSALLHIIINEKIPYQRNYLNFINKEHRSFMLFELFIGKLIKEKRIDCTEGLLLMGYDSDQQAKEMREKYCC